MLTADVDFPVPSGTVVKFTCMVTSMSKNISFKWECLNEETVLKCIENTTQFISEINRTTRSYDDKENCTCIAMVDGYTASSSIQLNISSE